MPGRELNDTNRERNLSARNNTAHAPSVGLVVVVRAWVDVRRVEVQVVGVVTIVRRR